MAVCEITQKCEFVNNKVEFVDLAEEMIYNNLHIDLGIGATFEGEGLDD